MADRERWRSEGQRRLAQLKDSGAAIARAVGVSRGSVSAWKSGAKSPNDDARDALERAFAIPARSWSERALSSPSTKRRKGTASGAVSPAMSPGMSPGPTPPRSGDGAGDPAGDADLAARFPEFDGDARAAILHFDDLLARVRQTIRTGDLRPSDLAKLAGEERRLVMDREKLLLSNYEGARIELLEEAVMRDSPRWARVRACIVDMLEDLAPYPKATARVLEAVHAMLSPDELAARSPKERERLEAAATEAR